MNKVQFELLDIKEQIEYINHQLKKGLSLSEVCYAIGISEFIMNTRLKSNGYTRILNQYVLEDELKNTSENKLQDEIQDELQEDLQDGSSTSETEKEENNALVKAFLNIPELVELFEKVNKLDSIVCENIKDIKELKENIQITSKPRKTTRKKNVLVARKFVGEQKQTTVRMNKDIHKRLGKIYKKYPLYNRQDVLNTLLDEILKKYE